MFYREVFYTSIVFGTFFLNLIWVKLLGKILRSLISFLCFTSGGVFMKCSTFISLHIFLFFFVIDVGSRVFAQTTYVRRDESIKTAAQGAASKASNTTSTGSNEKKNDPNACMDNYLNGLNLSSAIINDARVSTLSSAVANHCKASNQLGENFKLEPEAIKSHIVGYYQVHLTSSNLAPNVNNEKSSGQVFLNENSPSVKKAFPKLESSLVSKTVKPLVLQNNIDSSRKFVLDPKLAEKFKPATINDKVAEQQQAVTGASLSSQDQDGSLNQTGSTNIASKTASTEEPLEVMHSKTTSCEKPEWYPAIEKKIIAIDDAACSATGKSSGKRITSCMRFVKCHMISSVDQTVAHTFLRQALCSPDECLDEKKPEDCRDSKHAIFLAKDDVSKLKGKSFQKTGRSLEETEGQYQIKLNKVIKK
jgi:hypothetical protein